MGFFFIKKVNHKKKCFYSNLLRTIRVNRDVMIVQINCFIQLLFLPLGLTFFEIIQPGKCSNST